MVAIFVARMHKKVLRRKALPEGWLETVAVKRPSCKLGASISLRKYLARNLNEFPEFVGYLLDAQCNGSSAVNE